MDFFLFFIVFPLKEEEKKCWKGKVATRRVRINAESAAPGDKKTCKKYWQELTLALHNTVK
jgi:hypothetical protein